MDNYRPYTYDELSELMDQLNIVVKMKDTSVTAVITIINKRQVIVGANSIHYETLLYLYTWADDTPCGVPVE